VNNDELLTLLTPPVQVCPHCDFSETAARVYRGHSSLRGGGRASVEVEVAFHSAFCPYCGSKLVSECVAVQCRAPILRQDDRRCRKCGATYPWATRRAGEASTLRGQWRRNAVPLAEVNETRLWVVEGDIAGVGADAVVVTDDPYGFMIGEAADAIRSAWGEQIERDSTEAGPYEIGSAWVTDAGPRASSSWVVHVAALDYDKRTSEDIVTRAARAALASAETRRVQSLAYSALGTGVAENALDAEVSGHAIASAIEDSLRSRSRPSRVTDIVFVVFRPDVLGDFKKGLAQVFGPTTGSADAMTEASEVDGQARGEVGSLR
jgi:O-acetyl-ADP-ribose deacetylase (regulator of RNase III)